MLYSDEYLIEHK